MATPSAEESVVRKTDDAAEERARKLIRCGVYQHTPDLFDLRNESHEYVY